MNNKIIMQKIDSLTAEANFSLRQDVRILLDKAYRREKHKRARQALAWIIENAKLARIQHLAICQDTGLPVIFIEAGKRIRLDVNVVERIRKQVEKSYKKYYLRPSLVDPLRRASPSFSGALCNIEFTSTIKGLRITVLPKGFGCENKSRLKMFNPTARISEIEAFIVECARDAGPEACPPFVVGVGIGASADHALLLAKKALLSRMDKPNSDSELAGMEKRLLKKINSSGIGPMGLGGITTALAVRIKKAPTHIAGLPVAVNISCHALRSATAILK